MPSACVHNDWKQLALVPIRTIRALTVVYLGSALTACATQGGRQKTPGMPTCDALYSLPASEPDPLYRYQWLARYQALGPRFDDALLRAAENTADVLLAGNYGFTYPQVFAPCRHTIHR